MAIKKKYISPRISSILQNHSLALGASGDCGGGIGPASGTCSYGDGTSISCGEGQEISTSTCVEGGVPAPVNYCSGGGKPDGGECLIGVTPSYLECISGYKASVGCTSGDSGNNCVYGTFGTACGPGGGAG